MVEMTDPVFAAFPENGGPYSGNSVSEVFYTPNARGAAFYVVGDARNPPGKYFVHIVVMDMVTGKWATGKGVQVDASDEDLRVVTIYPSGEATIMDALGTIPCYWMVGVEPPGDGEFWMSIGVQLL